MRVNTPAAAQTSSMPETDGTAPETSDGWTKTEAPMIVPTTIAVARVRPIACRRPLGGIEGGRSWPFGGRGSPRGLNHVPVGLDASVDERLHLLGDRREHGPRSRPGRARLTRHGGEVEHVANERARGVHRERRDITEELLPVVALEEVLLHVRRVERGHRCPVVSHVLPDRANGLVAGKVAHERDD